MLQVGGDRHRWDLRTVGWCTWGCLFAVTAATFCFRFEPTLRPLLEMGWSPDEALKVPFWIASQLAIKVLQLMMRRFLYCTWPLKMPEQDYEFLVGDRSGWTPGKNEIHYYHETYGEQTIKAIDAFNRRWFHLVANSWRLYWYLGLASNLPEMFRLALMCETLSFWLKVFLERDEGFFGRLLLGVTARTRDGSLGRFNILMVSGWHYMGLLWCFMLPYLLGLTDEQGRVFFLLSMQGVMWGDTFGELVGGFCGRCEFPVWGFGDINIKTVEGVIGCLGANYVSMRMVSMAFPEQCAFIYPIDLAVAIAALVGTIAETVAPRGTDNAVILNTVMLTLSGMVLPMGE